MNFYYHLFKYTTLLLGVLLLSLSTWASIRDYNFFTHALKTRGVVINYVQKTTHLSSGDETLFYPVIQFFDNSNQKYDFKNAQGQYDPAYKLGDLVDVYYDPQNHSHARLEEKNGFLAYGIVGIFGFFLFSIGAGMGLYQRFKRVNKSFLIKQGHFVQAKFKEVIFSRNFFAFIQALKMSKNTYVVIAEWQNPQTRQIHLFKSEGLDSDVSEYLKNKEIKVYINPANLKEYYVDVSLLPSLT